jgi:protoporphyrinogen/coproporphyrinogen III oxidase
MAMMEERYDIAIVGGGLAGLTITYRLQRERPDLRVAVLESAPQPGGKVRTQLADHPEGRFLIEAGPDSFLAQKPWARELIEEIGLADDLVAINEMPRGVAILKHGRVIDWPSGVSLLAPTEFLPFLRTPLISPLGKARMALDLVLPAKSTIGDESIAAFAKRRLGQEALDWIAEPLLAGIYSADAEQLSLLATFPQLRELEREHGSLIRGLRAAKNARPAGKPQPAFLSLRNGMQSLVDRLVSETGETIRCNATVSSVSQSAVGFAVSIEGEPDILASRVVLATPAAATGDLIRTLAPNVATLLSSLRTANSGTISLAFRTEAITQGPPGYGLVIPGKERRPFNAVTVASRKFSGRAPQGWTLFRLFFGGARSPEAMQVGDGQLAELAISELHSLYGITAEPELYAISRWPSGNPIYEVGHLDRVAVIERELPAGLWLAGNAYRGAGIPDVIRNANEIAQQLIESAPATRLPLPALGEGWGEGL